MGVKALFAPALQVLLLPIMWRNVFCCQAMGVQPQTLRPEFFFSAPLQHADNIWNKKPVAKGQSWGQSILG